MDVVDGTERRSCADVVCISLHDRSDDRIPRSANRTRFFFSFRSFATFILDLLFYHDHERAIEINRIGLNETETETGLFASTSTSTSKHCINIKQVHKMC